MKKCQDKKKNQRKDINALNKLGKMFGNKKGQEEIMGFMLVVVLVIVIGLAMIFLFRPAQQEVWSDFQIENMLYSIMETSYQGEKISDRIEYCEYGEGCEELGEGIEEIMTVAFEGSGTVIGKNLKGYSLNMTGGLIYDLTEGSQTSQSRGAATVVSDTTVRLKFFF